MTAAGTGRSRRRSTSRWALPCSSSPSSPPSGRERRPAATTDAPRRKQRSACWLFAFRAITYLPSVFYLTALHQIAQSDASALTITLSVLLIAVVVLLIVELPIVLYLVRLERTERILDAWNRWLSRHGRSILVAAAWESAHTSS